MQSSILFGIPASGLLVAILATVVYMMVGWALLQSKKFKLLGVITVICGTALAINAVVVALTIVDKYGVVPM